VNVNRRLSRILVVGGSAASVIALTAATALASTASTWSISPAGAFTASLNKGTTTLLQDTTSKIVLTCKVSVSKGSVPKAGHGLSGKGIATITSTTFGSSKSKCTGPAGSTFTAVGSNLPWSLNAVKYNKSVDGGQTTGTITAKGTGVGGVLKGTVLGSKCSVTFGGTTSAPALANGLYDNKSHLLAITSVKNLKVTKSTCPGVTVGDGSTFITSPGSKAGKAVSHGYSVSPALKISSP
jgi:hypothetical protein